jgi:nucleoid-associated protein YgaU
VRRHAILLLTALVLAGCAQHATTTRVADVTKGDFYTNEEIKGLSQGARDQYCNALQSQIDGYHADAKRFDAGADSVKVIADSLKAQNTGMTTQLRDLDNEIRQLRLARRAASTYIVKAGDTLLKVSSVVYGSPDRWKEIFEANKDKIKKENDPLTPGTRLTIPAK